MHLLVSVAGDKSPGLKDLPVALDLQAAPLFFTFAAATAAEASSAPQSAPSNPKTVCA